MRLSYKQVTALWLTGLAFSQCPSMAAEPPPAQVPIEAFFQAGPMQSAKLSPSGRWLAVEASQNGSRRRLVMIDTQGKEPPRIIAYFEKSDVTGVSWVNDEWLTFSAEDVDYAGPRAQGEGLLSVRRDGEKLRLLIKRQWDNEFPARNNNPLEGNNVYMGLGRPNSNLVIVGEQHFEARTWDLTHVTLRTLDVATGATRLLVPNPPHPRITGWLLDSQGRARVASRIDGDQVVTYWADTKENWREISRQPILNRKWSPAYIEGDDTLVVHVSNPKTTESELRTLDIESGKVSEAPMVSTPGFDANVSPIQERETGKVFGLTVLTDGYSQVWLEPAMQAIQAKVNAALPGRLNELSCRPCDNPESVLIYSHSDRDPGQYLLYRPKQDQWQRFGAMMPQIDPQKMSPLKFVRTKTRDGADLPVWITRPVGAPANAELPAIVLVHGGPWSRGRKWEFDAESQFLASRGYVVIEPEFRGSEGFGDTHFRAGWKQWGKRMQDDLTDALQYAATSEGVDRKRVCIGGASYGGYAALMGPVRDPELYKCVVSWVGVTDPRLMFNVHWSDVSQTSKKHTMPEMVGDPVADAQMLAAVAPVELATKIKVPVLLAYGAKDMRVPLVHGEKMKDALKRSGNTPEWIVYDDEGHGWVRPQNQIDFWRKVEVFLAKNLKP